MLGLETIDNKTIRLVLEVTDELIEAEKSEAIRSNKAFGIPGFRQGKVPLVLVERAYSKDDIRTASIKHLIAKKVRLASKLLGFDPKSPQLNVESFGESAVSVDLAVPYQNKIEGYKGLAYEPLDLTPSEESIDEEIQAQRKLNARITMCDRPAEFRDRVVLSYTTKFDGEESPYFHDDDCELILGDDFLADGFDDQIVGLSVDDEKEFSLVLDKRVGPHPKGSTAEFKVKVKEVSIMELPEADDDFAQDISEFGTLNELRADLASKKLAELESHRAELIFQALIPKLIEKIDCPVTDKMIDYRVDQNLRDYQEQNPDMSWGDYADYTGRSLEDVLLDQRAKAFVDIKLNEALLCIAIQEDYKPLTQEVSDLAASLAQIYGINVENVPLDYVYSQLRRDFAKKLVIETAVEIPEKSVPAAESPEGSVPATESPEGNIRSAESPEAGASSLDALNPQ
jgi:trigger factor